MSMEQPAPVSVLSVLKLAAEALLVFDHEAEKMAFSHSAQSGALKHLRGVARGLRKQLRTLQKKGEDAALWEISEFVDSLRDIERKLEELRLS